mmetsp:Transcript_55194/g.112714  ORF Transcript_55194/g.112714 Transcript_55194/m.112714 type:complete len:226 (-) Transcript_55194:1265-1942(-)
MRNSGNRLQSRFGKFSLIIILFSIYYIYIYIRLAMFSKVTIKKLKCIAIQQAYLLFPEHQFPSAHVFLVFLHWVRSDNSLLSWFSDDLDFSWMAVHKVARCHVLVRQFDRLVVEGCLITDELCQVQGQKVATPGHEMRPYQLLTVIVRVAATSIVVQWSTSKDPFRALPWELVHESKEVWRINQVVCVGFENIVEILHPAVSLENIDSVPEPCRRLSKPSVFLDV